MSEPNDFDPIAASLRRQFSPPSLQPLDDRVETAARRLSQEAPRPIRGPSDSDDEPRLQVPSERGTSPRLFWGVAVAVAAAAILLVMLRPWQPTRGMPEPGPAGTAAESSPSTPDSQKVAGLQLDAFLSRRASLPGDDAACDVAAPPEACDDPETMPHLIADPSVQQIGECGGATAVDCADFELPADRALVVRLMPSGATAIVCIEHPWTDPHPELPAPSAYNIFRSQLGDYVIYEVTPLERAQATEFLRL